MPRTVSRSLISALQLTDLSISGPDQLSMIARCGPPTRLPDARSRAELAGAARPLGHRQGRRDPCAASRGRRVTTHQPSADTDVARPRRGQRAEQTAAHPAAAAAVGVAPNAAALARPARRPTLDLLPSISGQTAHRTPDTGPG